MQVCDLNSNPNSNPKNWFPDQNVLMKENITFTTNDPGSFKLAIGIFEKPEDTHPKIKLGIQRRTSTGWYIIGDNITKQ